MRIRFILVLLACALVISGCHRDDPTMAPHPQPPVSPATASTSTATTSNGATPFLPPQIVMNDLFQENQNADVYRNMALSGVKPAPVDLPGSAWQLATGDGNYEINLTPPSELGNLVMFHHVASAGLGLASNGSYVKPEVMTLSAVMSFGGNASTGINVFGFYSALSGEHSGVVLPHYTGLALQNDGGLQLVENGKPVGVPIKYTGTFDPSQKFTLTYSVDTSKGTIFNISLSGSTSSYQWNSTAFTDPATAFLGMGCQTDGVSVSFFNSVQLWSGVIPPPSPPLTLPDKSADASHAQ